MRLSLLKWLSQVRWHTPAVFMKWPCFLCHKPGTPPHNTFGLRHSQIDSRPRLEIDRLSVPSDKMRSQSAIIELITGNGPVAAESVGAGYFGLIPSIRDVRYISEWMPAQGDNHHQVMNFGQNCTSDARTSHGPVDQVDLQLHDGPTDFYIDLWATMSILISRH